MTLNSFISIGLSSLLCLLQQLVAIEYRLGSLGGVRPESVEKRVVDDAIEVHGKRVHLVGAVGAHRGTYDRDVHHFGGYHVIEPDFAYI